MADSTMVLLCVGLIMIGSIVCAWQISQWVIDRIWPEPVEASSASGNLANLVDLRQVKK